MHGLSIRTFKLLGKDRLLKIVELLADSAFSAFFRAVLAILTILASVARVGTGASRCENISRH